MGYSSGYIEDHSFGDTSVRISVEASSWGILFWRWCKIKVAATMQPRRTSCEDKNEIGTAERLRLDVRFPMPKSHDHYLAATQTAINSGEISLSESYSSSNDPFNNKNPSWMFSNFQRDCWVLYAVQVEYGGQTYEFTGRLLQQPPEIEPGWF